MWEFYSPPEWSTQWHGILPLKHRFEDINWAIIAADTHLKHWMSWGLKMTPEEMNLVKLANAFAEVARAYADIGDEELSAMYFKRSQKTDREYKELRSKSNKTEFDTMLDEI